MQAAICLFNTKSKVRGVILLTQRDKSCLYCQVGGRAQFKGSQKQTLPSASQMMTSVHLYLPQLAARLMVYNQTHKCKATTVFTDSIQS